MKTHTWGARQFIEFINPLRVDSIKWPAFHVWGVIAQLVEHCSANAEATGPNPVEAPINLFSGCFAMVISSFHLYSRSSHHFKGKVVWKSDKSLIHFKFDSTSIRQALDVFRAFDRMAALFQTDPTFAEQICQTKSRTKGETG